MKLDNWFIASPGTISGKVSGHPEKPDGKIVRVPIRGKRGGKIISYRHEYELGDAKPDYEEKFPNAKQRLLESLKEISDEHDV